MFPSERHFNVVNSPRFDLPTEEQGDFLDDVGKLLTFLRFNFQVVGLSPVTRKDGFTETCFTIYNNPGVNPSTYEIHFEYEKSKQWLRVHSLLSEHQSALVVQFLLERYLKVQVKEEPQKGRKSFNETCKALLHEYSMRNRRGSAMSCEAFWLQDSRSQAIETLKWLQRTWANEVKPAFDELEKILTGREKMSSYEIATMLQANRPHGDVKYNPIIKYLKTKSAIEIFEAKRKLLDKDIETIEDILHKYDDEWQRIFPLFVKVYKSLGMQLKARYMENARTAEQVTANYTGTSSEESKAKNKQAFENLCAALNAIAQSEVENACVAKSLSNTSANGMSNSTNEEDLKTIIEMPDFKGLVSCKNFCRILYQTIREKLTNRVHTETQAVQYILHNAAKGDLYYADCMVARRIQKDWSWERTTFTTYCKQKIAPKRRTIKRAAKKHATQKKVRRDLRGL